MEWSRAEESRGEEREKGISGLGFGGVMRRGIDWMEIDIED